jgi:hypothetical protein
VLKVQREEDPNLPAKRQRTIDDSLMPRIPASRKAQIDKELASCLYQTARPLSIFEEDCWIKFFTKNFGYTPPSTKVPSDSLLDEVYTEVKAEVKSKLHSSPYLCLVTDESTDIATNRVINTSVVTNTAESFYWSNIEAKEGTIGAKELATYMIKQAKEITDGDLSKWASTTTDTCSTMIAFSAEFEQNPKTKHVIPIPCDSHGLQLLIQDILLRPGIKPYWDEATGLVAVFKKAPKQYYYLRTEQEKQYKKRKSVIVAGGTRWGTQVGMLRLLEKTKEALREFAFRHDVDIKFKDKLVQHTW